MKSPREIAEELEAKGLWRRAATQWFLMGRECDDEKEAERLVWLGNKCLKRMKGPSKKLEALGSAPDKSVNLHFGFWLNMPH